MNQFCKLDSFDSCTDKVRFVNTYEIVLIMRHIRICTVEEKMYSTLISLTNREDLAIKAERKGLISFCTGKMTLRSPHIFVFRPSLGQT